MLYFIILIVIGFIIGTFGTLIGAGGGFILVPLLLLTNSGMSPAIITAISIAVVAANAISGSIAYAKSKRIDYKAGLLFGSFTIPGSILGVLVIKYIPLYLFDIFFGILLVVLSAYLLFKKDKKVSLQSAQNIEAKHLTMHSITDSNGETFTYYFNPTIGIVISTIIGFISPILGIGGGIIHVPAMVKLLKFPVYIATATSHFILAIMATVSVITHVFQGSYNNTHILKMILCLCVGVIPGAQLGAYISHKIKTQLIIKILAGCLAAVGVRILIQVVFK